MKSNSIKKTMFPPINDVSQMSRDSTLNEQVCELKHITCKCLDMNVW